MLALLQHTSSLCTTVFPVLAAAKGLVRTFFRKDRRTFSNHGQADDTHITTLTGLARLTDATVYHGTFVNENDLEEKEFTQQANELQKVIMMKPKM